MTERFDLTGLSGEVLDLASEVSLLGLLADLAPEWRRLASAADDGLDSAAKFLAWLPAALNEAETDALFAGLGLQPLLNKARTVKDRLAALPPDVERLLMPLESFAETETPQPNGRAGWIDGGNPGMVAWAPAFQAASPAVPGAPSLSLALGGALQCEAGALWPFKGDMVAPGLLRISLTGRMRAGGGATLPYRFGTAGVSGQAETACGVHYFFRETDGSRLLAAALAEALVHLPNPLDPTEIWKAVALLGLEGLILTFDGEAELGIDIAIGRDIALPALIAGPVQGTIAARLARGAAYQLSFRALGDATAGTRRLIATLSRDARAAERWSAGLDLSLDLVGLVGRVHRLLTEGLQTWDEGLETVKPFLLPGQWLRDRADRPIQALISRLIADEGLKAALIHDLDLAFGRVSEGDAALVAEIAEQVIAAIDSVAGAATDKVSQIANAAVDALPAFAGSAIRPRLETELATLLGGYEEALKALAEQLAGTGAREVGKALQKLGVEIQGGVRTADNVLDGVRALIDRYDRLLRKVVTETAEGAHAKLVARLSYEESRIKETRYELRGTFRSLDGEAGRLYHALVLGRLAAFQRAFETQVPGFELDPDGSSIRRFAQRDRKLGYALVLLGLDVEGGAILSGKAETWRLGNGDVRVAAEGGFRRWRRSRGEERSLSFASSHALLIARAKTEVDRSVATLSLAATHADNDLRRREVTGFLSRLVECGLLADARRLLVEREFDRWTMTRGGEERIEGRLGVALTLDADGIAALIGAGRAAGMPTGARRLFGLAVAAMRYTDAWTGASFHTDVKECREARGEQSRRHPDATDFLFAIRDHMPTDPGGPRAPVQSRFNGVRERVAAANALVELASRAAAIFDSVPAPAGDWTAERYQKAEEAIAKASALWLRLNGIPFFAFKPEMHRRTAAFFFALACLARGTEPGDQQPSFDAMVTVTMQRDGQPEIIIP